MIDASDRLFEYPFALESGLRDAANDHGHRISQGQVAFAFPTRDELFADVSAACRLSVSLQHIARGRREAGRGRVVT